MTAVDRAWRNLRRSVSEGHLIPTDTGETGYLLQFTDGVRSMLTSVAKIAGYREYVPEDTFRMGMAEGLGLI